MRGGLKLIAREYSNTRRPVPCEGNIISVRHTSYNTVGYRWYLKYIYNVSCYVVSVTLEGMRQRRITDWDTENQIENVYYDGVVVRKEIRRSSTTTAAVHVGR
jgi:hypothetical protein